MARRSCREHGAVEKTAQYCPVCGKSTIRISHAKAYLVGSAACLCLVLLTCSVVQIRQCNAEWRESSAIEARYDRLRLSSGEHVKGTILVDSITIRSRALGPTRVSLTKLRSMRPTPKVILGGASFSEFRLRDGTTLEGNLDEPDLRVRLVSGTEVVIETSRIKSIGFGER